MALETTIVYDTPGSFTYDTDEIEITGGKAQLKSQQPSDSIFAANFNPQNAANAQDGIWGSGALTGTLTNATVASDKLNCKGGTVKYCSWAALGNANFTQTGTVKFKYTPDYTGAPATARYLFSISEGTGTNDNLIVVTHLVTGNINVQVFDSTGSGIVSNNSSMWSNVQGTEYEFEINFDFTGGTSRLFVDGVLLGTYTGTGTRDITTGFLRMGTDRATVGTSDGEFDDVIVYNTVQHTVNYTPGYNSKKYVTDDPTIALATTIQTDSLDFVNTLVATVPGSEQLKIHWSLNGVAKYWNGSAWVNSDGSLAQSNTFAELTSVVMQGLTSSPSTVKPILVLHSNNGNDTPDITSYRIEYDFAVTPAPTFNKCIVWGFVQQSDGTMAGITVYAKLADLEVYNSVASIIPANKSTITDSRGYWELELVNTDDMDTDSHYDFDLGGYKKKKKVPDESTKRFEDLTDY